MLKRVAHGSDEYKQIVALRDEVLRKPLGLVFTKKQLAAEANEEILSDWRESGPVATLQFARASRYEWKMRQVAVAADLQGQGVGSRLVRFAEDWASRSGVRLLSLHAREAAAPFYRRLGYKTVGERFVEVGIPHLAMEKELAQPTGFLEYARTFPEDLADWIERSPVAVLPWGALEWHGSHLPLGLDGLVAEAFARRLAARVQGVLFPTSYLPITTLPHSASIEFETNTLRLALADISKQLQDRGFRAALLVTGHYAQGHMWEMIVSARRNWDGCKLLAASPLEVLEREDLLDHAGRWEAGCLDMFEANSMRLETLAGQEIQPKAHAVLGDSPLDADPIEAWEAMDLAWAQWGAYTQSMLEGSDDVLAYYDRRQAIYKTYKERYFQISWNQALEDWWKTK